MAHAHSKRFACVSCRVSPGVEWPSWRPGSADKVTYVTFWSRPERGLNFFPWASTDGARPISLPTSRAAARLNTIVVVVVVVVVVASVVVVGGGWRVGDQTNDPFFIPRVAKDILGLVPHGEIGNRRSPAPPLVPLPARVRFITRGVARAA